MTGEEIRGKVPALRARFRVVDTTVDREIAIAQLELLVELAIQQLEIIELLKHPGRILQKGTQHE